MRLPDIVNQFRRKASEGSNFVRNPLQVIFRHARKRGQTLYENAEVPGQNQDQKNNRQDLNTKQQDESEVQRKTQSPLSYSSSQTRVVQNVAVVEPNATLSDPSFRPRTSIISNSSDSQSLYPLQLNEELKGTWGTRYRVQKILQHNDWRYLYKGTQEYGEEQVWIYAYVLSRATFNPQQVAERKAAFDKLINANLKLGHDRDFRILKIEDAFVDSDRRNQDCCYLVTKAFSDACTLSEYLERSKTPIAPVQVKQILMQVLQSLKYLHLAYRVYWSSDRSQQGLYHGNLSLDSLWFRAVNRNTLTGAPQFFIYLTNFALWEHLFSPEANPIASSSEELANARDDLSALGWIAFSLLTGYKINPQALPDNLEPEDARYWSRQTINFKPFILRLLGKGLEPSFKTTVDAEAALRNLDLNAPVIIETPQKNEITHKVVTAKPKANSNIKNSAFLLFALLIGLGGVFFTVLWLLNRQVESQTPVSCPFDKCPQQVEDIQNLSNFKGRELPYAVETSSSWNTVLQKSLTGNNLMSLLEQEVSGLDFSQEIPRAQKSSVILSKILSDNESLNETEKQGLSPKISNLKKERIIQELRTGNIDFALVQLADKQSELLLEEFEFEVVGFDAIAILVAYSDANRTNSIPNFLSGEISLNQLRQIFTGKNTGEIQYEPFVMAIKAQEEDPEVVKDKAREMESVIADFQQLAFLSEQENIQFLRFIESDNRVKNIYQHLLAEFESQETTGSIIQIGFDRLSTAFGECSVYPLAIRHGNTLSSLLVESGGQAITPYTELCDKGGYWANSAAFPISNQEGKERLDRDHAYPLATELVVVYPKCSATNTEPDVPCNAGQAFAQMLKTVEGQYFLSEIGVVPMIPIEQIRQILWSPPSTE